MPACIEILRHPPQRLDASRAAASVSFAERRHVAAPRSPRSSRPHNSAACRSTSRYTLFKNLHDPSILSSLHSRSFSGGAANSVYSRPVSAPYFSAISFAPTTFPFDFDMATPPFSTMPCVNSRANRLVVLHQSQIAHHLAPEPRIQQVQNRMRNPADVLINLKPVRDLPSDQTAPRHCADRNTDRNTTTNPRTYPSCPFRAAPVRRTSGKSYSQTPASPPAAIPLARQLHIFRQHHRQMIVRHRHHPILLAIHHRNRRAPIPLPRNAPIFQPITSSRA